MELLKRISKFFGGAFFGIGLTLLLFGIFAGFVIDDAEVLRGRGEEIIVGMFSSPEFLESLMQRGENSGKTLEDVKALCQSNPEIEECKILKQLEEDPKAFVGSNPDFKKGTDDLNKQIDGLVDGLNNFKPASKAILVGSSALIVLGLVFIFLGYMDWKKASYKVSVKAAILTGLAAIYYKLIQKLLIGDLLVNKINLGGFPLAPIKDFLAGWVNPVFNKMFILCLVLTVVFVILGIVFYYLKEKDLKKGNKGK